VLTPSGAGSSATVKPKHSVSERLFSFIKAVKTFTLRERVGKICSMNFYLFCVNAQVVSIARKNQYTMRHIEYTASLPNIVCSAPASAFARDSYLVEK